MKKTLFACMASMMIVILGCENEPSRCNTSAPYEINFYADTISGYLILTTVCNNPDNTCLSASSISLGKVDTAE
jgi:hypothetical protein